LGLKANPWANVMCKFQTKKKRKIPFVVSCPKSLCCQKTKFGPLGVKATYYPEWPPIPPYTCSSNAHHLGYPLYSISLQK